jgi:tetratricopeptide (TPR) repeat protein
VLAFLIALIWTVHPLNTESVTYLSQRAESLMGLLYLLTLYCFIRYTGGEPPGAMMPGKARTGPPSCVPRSGTSAGEQAGVSIWPLLSVGFCLLGAATKEVIVTAPVIVLLYDRTFVAGSFREAWLRRRGYYLALAGSWVVLGGLALGAGNRGGTAGLGVGLSPWAYALTQPAALLHYLRLAAWPRPLVFDYGAEWVAHPADTLPAALAVVALVAAAALAFFRAPRPLGFAGACFFLILAPTSLTPGIRQTLAEHRMYLPLAAVLSAGAAGLSALAGAGWRRRAVLALFTICSASCLVLTIGRNRDYATKVALYRDTLDKRPGNIFAWYNLAGALAEAGDHAAAARLYREVVRREPGAPDAWLRLGKSLAALGRLEEAASCLGSGLRMRPNDAEAHRVLGGVLLRLGRARNARWHLDAAARLDPGGAAPRLPCPPCLP